MPTNATRAPLIVTNEARTPARDKGGWGKNYFIEGSRAMKRPGTVFDSPGTIGLGIYASQFGVWPPVSVNSLFANDAYFAGTLALELNYDTTIQPPLAIKAGAVFDITTGVSTPWTPNINFIGRRVGNTFNGNGANLFFYQGPTFLVAQLIDLNDRSIEIYITTDLQNWTQIFTVPGSSYPYPDINGFIPYYYTNGRIYTVMYVFTPDTGNYNNTIFIFDAYGGYNTLSDYNLGAQDGNYPYDALLPSGAYYINTDQSGAFNGDYLGRTNVGSHTRTPIALFPSVPNSGVLSNMFRLSPGNPYMILKNQFDYGFFYATSPFTTFNAATGDRNSQLVPLPTGGFYRRENGGLYRYAATAALMMASTFTTEQAVIASSNGPRLYPIPTAPDQPFDFVQKDAAAGAGGFIVKSNTAAYAATYNGTNISYTTIPNANVSNMSGYPVETVRGVAYLDGTYYVADPNARVWGSDINDPLTWSPLNVLEAQAEPDGAVAIARQLQYIVVFGKWTIEFFQDAGNPTGSPLLPYTSAFLEMGCVDGNSVAQAENTIGFIGQTRTKGVGVYTLNGTSPQYISNPSIDRIISENPKTKVRAFWVKISGHYFYVLSLDGITLAWDQMGQDWKEWTTLYPQTNATVPCNISGGYGLVTFPGHNLTTGSPLGLTGIANLTGPVYPTAKDSINLSFVAPTGVADGNYTVTAQTYSEQPFLGRYYCAVGLNDYFQDDDGNLYTANIAVGADELEDGTVPITVESRLPHWDGGVGDWKFVNECRVVADVMGVTLWIRWSDDDCQTWSDFVPLGLQSEVPFLQRLGRTRRRVWQVKTGDSASPLRLEALELDIVKGNR